MVEVPLKNYDGRDEKMADVFMHYLSQAVSEVITILIGTLLTFLSVKAHAALDALKKKNKVVAEISKMEIVSSITDQVAEYAEAQLTGEAGQAKLDFAVDKAIKILASKGIVVSKDEILAGIENGVNKLKQRQL